MNMKDLKPIQINVLAKDHAALKAKAKLLGLTLTGYCRMLLMKSLY